AHFAADVRALATSPKFIGSTLSGALGSAPFYTFIGGAPYVMVDMMGRTSAEYGLWFVGSAIGFIAGNLAASRLAPAYGIDRMIFWGILITVFGALVSTIMCLIDPDVAPVTVFLPQAVISLGNGLLLPTAIAGAVSVRPQIAGTASGLAGFSQMAIGAVAAQVVSHTLAAAASPLPLLAQMLALGLATAIAFLTLVRRG